MTNPQFWFGADYIIGLRSWFRNFSHSHILEYGPVDLATIRCPYVEYFIYSLFKSVQVASFVGGLIVAPAYRRYRWKVLKQDQITKNSSKVIKAASKQLQGRILLGSIFSTPLLMGASVYINGYTTETLAMRCYEIRCGELTHDRTTVFMAWLGWYCKRFQGAVDGINCALLYTIVDKKVLRKYFNPIDMDSVYRKGLPTYQDLDEPQLDSTTLFQFVKKKMLEGGMTQLRKNTSQSDEKPVEK